ncbi:hypothetical protein LLEC1_00954 [Akanthomyces lecanii]|uniref:Uncharacterized protein n=1 Tax=Cordyceps confragosa TaxID=2714763 RepID=A0A179I5R6_CORDF|nr:hypothetical protein LLEC1_00954 [Akanthomyces lecanii]
MEWLNQEWQHEEDHDQDHDDDDMHAVQALHHHNSHPHGTNFHSPVVLDRRSTAGSSTSDGHAPSTSDSFRSSYGSYRHVPASSSPSPHATYEQTSPGFVSSINYFSVPGGWSPLHRQPSFTPSQTSGQSNPQTPRSPQSRSEAGSVLGSPVSLIRSQFSDLSVSSLREREREREQERIHEEERELREQRGIAEAQAKELIAEANKLNEELSQVAENLKARQEEMEHINNLLVERTERAAERIVFLQNRVSYLEGELNENDDELQHLRICLKAVEIQLPPNPDRELQRCINVFKEDFRQLKHNRASRGVSLASSSHTLVASAPTTPKSGSGGAGNKRPSTAAASYKMYTTPTRNDMN